MVSIASSSVAYASPERGTWFVSIDNDSLANSDDDYTSGLQLGWVSGYLSDFNEAPIPEFIGNKLSEFSFLSGHHRQRFISHSISHRIFTPGDTETSSEVIDDLPYSAILFASLTAGAQDSRRMDALSFHYGLVGPAALGDQIQNEFHKLIGADPVNGWDHQLRNEPLLNLNYEHRKRLVEFGIQGDWKGDIIGQAGGAIGNLISMGTLGVGVRYGVGLKDDFYIPPQFFGEETIGSRPYTKSGNNESLVFFVLLNGSLVGNAIFWDGNTYKKSASVDYSRGIGRLYVGVVKRFNNFGISFALTNTTVPWENPDNKSFQTYGRLGFVFGF